MKITLLRRCVDCGRPLGNRDRFCQGCGARQPREPRVPLVALLLACSAAAQAQDYPAKPLRLVVGYPPGGANDIAARQIAPGMSEGLGVQVVVDNRAGANGMIGGEFVSKSSPDGYTLGLAGLSPLVLSAFTYARVPYDALNDFAGITTVVVNPELIVVHPALPVRAMKELIALGKAQPGKLDFATAGNGGISRMLIELMKIQTGIKVQHVAYKGAGPALIDLLGGQVQGMVMDLPVLYPQVKTGKLRALAITSEQRSALLPHIATVRELGYPALQAVNWLAIMAPSKTPRAIVKRLHEVIAKAATAPDFQQRVIAGGSVPMLSASPEAYMAFLKQEFARWRGVATAANIRVQ
jgi:tripartite-type tricarboxylate transporter receptor subunit TctC